MSAAPEDLTDAALRRLVDGGRFETLAVWEIFVSYLVAHDEAWGPEAVLGVPQAGVGAKGDLFLVSAGLPRLPGQRCDFVTSYPFLSVSQVLWERGEDGAEVCRGVRTDPLGPDWTKALKAGAMPDAGEEAE